MYYVSSFIYNTQQASDTWETDVIGFISSIPQTITGVARRCVEALYIAEDTFYTM